MNSSEVTAARHIDVDVFLSKHLNPSPGRPVQDVKDRILHWISVCNNPSQFTSTTDVKALAEIRRKARQNVRRLVARHRVIAAEISMSLQPEVTR